ncbi:hypothetical protein [uncultured Methylovirgula sp.]|uniref:hypothetical protein n=1 Tax=uncultured Methylovirgula sp. TaxID=1285960 RepID=UPI00261A1398|nr:hypothetical protein [uncultured Methylovirgula sp.]
MAVQHAVWSENHPFTDSRSRKPMKIYQNSDLTELMSSYMVAARQCQPKDRKDYVEGTAHPTRREAA